MYLGLSFAIFFLILLVSYLMWMKRIPKPTRIKRKFRSNTYVNSHWYLVRIGGLLKESPKGNQTGDEAGIYWDGGSLPCWLQSSLWYKCQKRRKKKVIFRPQKRRCWWVDVFKRYPKNHQTLLHKLVISLLMVFKWYQTRKNNHDSSHDNLFAIIFFMIANMA